MKLIDSNIIIYSAHSDYAYLRPLLLNPSHCVSAISKVEVLGFHDLSLKEIRYFESVFALLDVLEVEPPIVHLAIGLRQKRRIKLGDSLIAATALFYDLELNTRNVVDFQPIEELRIANPVLD